MSRYKEAIKLIEHELQRGEFKSHHVILSGIKKIVDNLKRCNNCKKEINFEDNYCKHCGADLQGEEAE